jgi:hypothetical protein
VQALHIILVTVVPRVTTGVAVDPEVDDVEI